VVVAFLCGCRAEQQHAWFSRLSRAVESRRSYYEPFRIVGDPTLARILMLRPARHVPTLTSPEEMLGWREAIRRQLIADLYAEVFVAEEKSSTFDVLQEVSVDGGMSRAFVTYEAADGTTIPAYLFRPPIDPMRTSRIRRSRTRWRYCRDSRTRQVVPERSCTGPRSSWICDAYT
jgi:hypothetical protein